MEHFGDVAGEHVILDANVQACNHASTTTPSFRFRKTNSNFVLGNAFYVWMQEVYIHLINKGAFSLGALRMHIGLLREPSNGGCNHTEMNGKVVRALGVLYCMGVANSSFFG